MSDFYLSGIPPKPIGFLTITSSFTIAIYEPINWFHRLMLRLLLGWKYTPIKADKERKE